MSLAYLTLPEMLEDEDYQGFYAGAFSPDGRYVLTNVYRGMWTLDRTTEAYIEAYDPATLDSFNGVAIDNDGTVYALSAGPQVLVKIPDFGRDPQETLVSGALPAQAANAGTMRLFIMPDASKKLVWADSGGAHVVRVYDIALDSLTIIANGSAYVFQQIVQDSYGDVWAVGADGAGGVIFQRVVDGGAGTAAPDYNLIAGFPAPAGHSQVEAYHSSSGWFLVYGGGTDLYLLDDEDFSELAHREYAANGSILGSARHAIAPFLMGLAPGATDFWFPGPVSYAEAAYSDLHKLSMADLTSLDTKEATDWLIGDTIDVSRGLVISTHTQLALISGALVPPSDDPPPVTNYTTVLRYFTDAGEGGGGGGDGLQDESLRLRVWPYMLDGHAYAVFRLGPSETLVYDLTTNQWASWASPGRNNWRAHVGQNWIGMSTDTLERGFGSDIVAGDDASNVLWVLDPTSGRDDRSTTGDDPFTRTVTGLITLDGREVLNCGAVTLALSKGNPSQEDAFITLFTSDDGGHNWINHGFNVIVADAFSAVVEWRALGHAKAPGRLFKFEDNGATTRISSADLR